MTDSENKIPDEELEEGELSSDEEGGGVRQPEAPPPSQAFHHTPTAPQSIHSPVKDKQPDFGAGPPPEEGDEEDRKYNRRRRKKEHKKRKRESRDKKKANKPGPPKYVDHDQISEEFSGYQAGDWPGAGGFPQRSPPGPYDSPAGSNSAEDFENNDAAWQHRRKQRGDKFNNRPAPGPYDSPYDSTPGVYDSPSDPDEYGPPHKMKRNEEGNIGQQHRSMMSMVDEEYMDPNVAANEREEMFDRRKKNPPTASKLRKMEKSRHYREQQQMRRELTKGEKKALKSMAEQQRPACRFYMEGKCNKGYDCQFNHGFDPPKKFEVCKFYISDSCTKGRDCLYVHSEFPCRFHHKHGYCERGDNCKFSHTELNEQTRDWLMQSAGFIAREEERLENEGMIPPLQKVMSRPQDEDLRPHKKPLLSTPPHIPEMHHPMMDMDHNMGGGHNREMNPRDMNPREMNPREMNPREMNPRDHESQRYES
ncbi:hypothetical protein CAPTEDRAFT_223326 [Capitella teleta]|uniref:C3H1-type domain-containing protein n=1 Tax=Capitella teleta TaxID=283909 RepID=R7UCI2_CAPTE|nr:hypothetical protein CAPTEDRAFT_223326 [Capitella teleta]|eukprot:ELU03826.1 hypothetical protein CAPTEDRAFT_223326 [Capitella teleta]